MNERSHLLMIAYYFPPLGMGGVQRPLKLAKYLPEFGWDVTVITVAEAGYYATDQSLVSELPPSVIVKPVKVRDPGHWLRSRVQRGRASGHGHASPPGWARQIQQIARWPDEKFPFVRPAMRAAERIHAEKPFDAILTTSPPPSVHAAGMRFRNRHKTPWVADFRDPWLVREGDWGPTRFHERYAKRLRAQIVGNADTVIASNNAIAAGLDALGPMKPVEVVPNGYDEADFASLTGERPGSDEFRILLYGTLSPVVDPAPALRIIAQWRCRHPNRRLRIVHVGLCVGIDTEAVTQSCGLHDVYESTGYLPHRDAVAHLCRADVIIIPLTTKLGFASTVPGRLFEAMRSLRPIVLVGPTHGETAKILSPIQNTWVVSPDAVEAGIAALDEIAAQPKGAPARAIGSLKQFERRDQAGRVAALMDALQRERKGQGA